MISYREFRRLLSDVPDCANYAQFCEECSGSVELDNPDDVLRLLRLIWDVASGGLTIDKLIAASKQSMRGMARDYDISYNTMQTWHYGTRSPSDWALPLIAYAVVSDIFAETGEY